MSTARGACKTISLDSCRGLRVGLARSLPFQPPCAKLRSRSHEVLTFSAGREQGRTVSASERSVQNIPFLPNCYCLRNKRLLTSPLLHLQDYERWHSVFFPPFFCLLTSPSFILSCSLPLSKQASGQSVQSSLLIASSHGRTESQLFPVCPVRAAFFFFHLILSFFSSPRCRVSGQSFSTR